MTVGVHLFCLGFGCCARVLARRIRDAGGRVSATCRDPDRASRLRAAGIEAHVYDSALPDATLPPLGGVSHILVSAPPPASGGDPAAAAVTRAVAAGPGPSPAWIGYLSTTGVYGDRAGGWVDEDSPLLPSGDRGRRRVLAEADWLALRRDTELPVHVFRLAGIYGPGRSQFDGLRAGTAKRIDKPGQVFSRIHVDDIVATLLASMARPAPGRVYNLCDDDPAPPAEVVAFAAALLGIEPPPLVPIEAAGLSPMGRSFYDDNKRVRNDRIKEELGVRLHYPSYREGLRAILAAEAAPG